MTDREDLKLTRLGFLKNIDSLLLRIGDFSLLETEIPPENGELDE